MSRVQIPLSQLLNYQKKKKKSAVIRVLYSIKDHRIIMKPSHEIINIIRYRKDNVV